MPEPELFFIPQLRVEDLNGITYFELIGGINENNTFRKVRLCMR